MLHTQSHFSMHSTLASDHSSSSGVRPNLPQLYDLDWNKGRESLSKGSKSGHTSNTLWSRSGATAFQHGLHTPPHDRNGINGNSMFGPDAEALPFKGVPVVSSNAPPYSTSMHTLDNRSGGHSRQNSKSQPFYSSYYSARQPSPRPQQTEIQPDESSRRQSSNDVNSIATHLQIPSSINGSKGSLPDLAAQVIAPLRFSTRLG